jgi:hypothetical protein
MGAYDFSDIAAACLQIFAICLPRISVSDANWLCPNFADTGHSVLYTVLCLLYRFVKEEVAKSCKSGGVKTKG